MSRHVAFFNIPALGHLYPTLPVVSELVRRGHRVTYPAVASRAELVRAAGARVVEYESSRPSDSDPGFKVPVKIAESLQNFLTEAECTLPQLEEALLADRPDLVVFDRTAFAGSIFARKHGIGAVQLWPMLVSGPQWSWVGDVDLDDPAWLAYQTRCEKFLANQGVSLDPMAPEVLRHIAFLPRAFQPFQERFGPEYEFVGPCLAPRGDSWRPPAGAAKIALVTLGSLNNRHLNFYRLCFEAFQDTDWHVVLPIGRRLRAGDLGPVPPNFEVVPSVAQLDVLRHASVFVSHAGLGGVLEAIAAGVPQVAIARTAEQKANAARIVELGLGAKLDECALTSAALYAAVQKVRSEGLANLRREIIASGGTLRAADVIEECLSG